MLAPDALAAIELKPGHGQSSHCPAVIFAWKQRSAIMQSLAVLVAQLLLVFSVGESGCAVDEQLLAAAVQDLRLQVP